ncbi:MAG: geranylgeranylglycerol-phosphate geranylgeranyltransferase [Bacteroidales bacterium]
MTFFVKHYARLVRIGNLFIIALTMYMLRWALVKPMLEFRYSELLETQVTHQFSDFQFFLLVLSITMIAAAGYIINDYFDRATDFINRPDKVILGRFITRRTAIALHWILSITGVALGFYLAIQINLFAAGNIFFIAAALLWFYSTNLNRMFLVGNVTIAFLTALIPFLLALFEIVPLNKEYRNFLISFYLNFNPILHWLLGYSAFAFLSTLIREIVKDMQDFEGDNQSGRRSLPIELGIQNTKKIVIGLTIVMILLLLL